MLFQSLINHICDQAPHFHILSCTYPLPKNSTITPSGSHSSPTSPMCQRPVPWINREKSLVENLLFRSSRKCHPFPTVVIV